MEQLLKNNINNINNIKDYIKKKYNCLDIYPLVLTNINFNFNIESYLINKVIIWFKKNQKDPLCVTKIIRDKEHLQMLEKSMSFIKNYNQKFKHKIFNEGLIENYNKQYFTIEEICKGKSYEASLNESILGPSKNIKFFMETSSFQLKNLNEICQQAKEIKMGDNLKWSIQFNNIFSEIEKNKLNSQTIRFNYKISKIINRMNIKNSFVFPDLVNPNIFPGLKLIDNYHPNISELHTLIPGELNLYRYIFLNIISPPINFLVTDAGSAINYICQNKKKEGCFLNIYQDLLINDNFSEEEKKSMFIFSINFEFLERIKIFKNNTQKTKEQIISYEKIINQILREKIDKSFYIKTNNLLKQIDNQDITIPKFDNKNIFKKIFKKIVNKIIKKFFSN
jgi:hypothetical protein